MKLIIISMVLLCSSVALADENPAPTQATDKILERVDAAGQWVSTTLEQLADKLGTTVSYLWPTYVRRVVAEGASLVGLGLFLWLLGAVFCAVLRMVSRYFRFGKGKGENDSEFNAGASAFFSWALLVVLLIAGGIVISNGIVDFVAPEPQALENLVNSVRSMNAK
jgi:hypothetical protein